MGVVGFFAGTASASAAENGPLEGASLDAGAMELARDVAHGGALMLDGLLELGFFFGPIEGHEACASLRGLGLAILGLSALVIIALFRMRIGAEHRRLDIVLRLVERGLPIPEGLMVAPVHRDLRRGVVLLCTGAGIACAGLLLGERGLGAAGAIPAFIGVGYLVAVKLSLAEGLVTPQAPEDDLGSGQGPPPRRRAGPGAGGGDPYGGGSR